MKSLKKLLTSKKKFQKRVSQIKKNNVSIGIKNRIIEKVLRIFSV